MKPAAPFHDRPAGRTLTLHGQQAATPVARLCLVGYTITLDQVTLRRIICGRCPLGLVRGAQGHPMLAEPHHKPPSG